MQLYTHSEVMHKLCRDAEAPGWPGRSKPPTGEQLAPQGVAGIGNGKKVRAQQ
jgi:hypothetical protein